MSGEHQVSVMCYLREFQVKFKISQSKVGKGLVKVRGSSDDGQVVR